MTPRRKPRPADNQASATYDRDIRPSLRTWIDERCRNHRDTVVIEELGLSRRHVRADVAVVNGILHGYEIKSERDSLRRLGRQVPLYGAVFDRVTLVVSKCHLASATTALPPWWEIVTFSDGRFRVARRGTKNPQRDARTLVELIWRDDALRLLAARGGDRGFRSKPREFIWDRICALYSLEEVAAEVRAALKARVAREAALPSV